MGDNNIVTNKVIYLMIASAQFNKSALEARRIFLLLSFFPSFLPACLPACAGEEVSQPNPSHVRLRHNSNQIKSNQMATCAFVLDLNMTVLKGDSMGEDPLERLFKLALAAMENVSCSTADLPWLRVESDGGETRVVSNLDDAKVLFRCASATVHRKLVKSEFEEREFARSSALSLKALFKLMLARVRERVETMLTSTGEPLSREQEDAVVMEVVRTFEWLVCGQRNFATLNMETRGFLPALDVLVSMDIVRRALNKSAFSTVTLTDFMEVFLKLTRGGDSPFFESYLEFHRRRRLAAPTTSVLFATFGVDIAAVRGIADIDGATFEVEVEVETEAEAEAEKTDTAALRLQFYELRELGDTAAAGFSRVRLGDAATFLAKVDAATRGGGCSCVRFDFRAWDRGALGKMLVAWPAGPTVVAVDDNLWSAGARGCVFSVFDAGEARLVGAAELLAWPTAEVQVFRHRGAVLALRYKSVVMLRTLQTTYLATQAEHGFNFFNELHSYVTCPRNRCALTGFVDLQGFLRMRAHGHRARLARTALALLLALLKRVLAALAGLCRYRYALY